MGGREIQPERSVRAGDGHGGELPPSLRSKFGASPAVPSVGSGGRAATRRRGRIHARGRKAMTRITPDHLDRGAFV